FATDRFSDTPPPASPGAATTASTPVGRCCGAPSARVTWPRATSCRFPCAEARQGGSRQAFVEERTMRRRLLIAAVVALVLGALAAPAVLAGNDYSDPAYAQHDLDN